jgi:hypothetical protein
VRRLRPGTRTLNAGWPIRPHGMGSRGWKSKKPKLSSWSPIDSFSSRSIANGPSLVCYGRFGNAPANRISHYNVVRKNNYRHPVRTRTRYGTSSVNRRSRPRVLQLIPRHAPPVKGSALRFWAGSSIESRRADRTLTADSLGAGASTRIRYFPSGQTSQALTAAPDPPPASSVNRPAVPPPCACCLLNYPGQALRIEAISDFASTVTEPERDASRMHHLFHHTHHVVREGLRS